LSQILERPVENVLPPASLSRPFAFRNIRALFLQIIRFGMVGGLNTILDLLIFNSLLWLMPTQSTTTLLVYNSIAYCLGGINSFLLNKYWTFRNKQKITLPEIARFAITTALGILCNDLLIWLISRYFHPIIADARLWANASKIVALCGTVLISYLGMRLWVFVAPKSHSQEDAHAKA
jgi:putative flippase GtrA